MPPRVTTKSHTSQQEPPSPSEHPSPPMAQTEGTGTGHAMLKSQWTNRRKTYHRHPRE